MQQIRPRSLICPLQLATAVDAKVDFQSRSIVDDLHAKGFSSSYDVAMEFIDNAALLQGTNVDCLAPNSVFQVSHIVTVFLKHLNKNVQTNFIVFRKQ